VAQEYSAEVELLAQKVSSHSEMIGDLQERMIELGHLRERMIEVEKVNTRLETAALTTARALQQVAHHWDAVYEAMRREELTVVEEDLAELKEDLS
jgi:predicted hotdog family 3-hydroxylacyl-ACP dehydratase